MDLVFATHNPDKLREIKLLLPAFIRLYSLSDIGCTEDIPETADSLEGNAWLKANYVARHYGRACFADDTGLMVDTLGGEPGVRSARYAGANKSAIENIEKLLSSMKQLSDRKAHFRTVIAANMLTYKKAFVGEVAGHITHQPKGTGGFGYDPVFQPEGFEQTFAELPIATKNSISHRSKAFEQFVNHLKTLPHAKK